MKQQKGHLKEQRQADGNGGLKEQRQAGGSGRSSSKNPKREVEMDDDDHHRRRNDKPSMNTSKSIGPARGPPVPEVRKTEKKSSPTQGLSSVKRTVVDLDDDIVDEDVQQQRSPETGVLPQAVDVSTVNKNKPVPQRQGDFLTEQSQDQCNINKGEHSQLVHQHHKQQQWQSSPKLVVRLYQLLPCVQELNHRQHKKTTDQTKQELLQLQ